MADKCKWQYNVQTRTWDKIQGCDNPMSACPAPLGVPASGKVSDIVETPCSPPPPPPPPPLPPP